jgi:serine/threonine-protein kinase
VLGVKLEQRIGGIGECWEGKLDKKPVRVFLLAPESPLTASALEELVGRLQVLVGLQGEGLSELLAAGSVGRGLGLVYEAKGAGDLEERLERSKSSWDQVRPLLLSALMGLKILHERGLVHRELSPDRIRLDRGGRPFIEGGGLATMLVGFSGSRIAARPIRAPWMAPEQLLEGEVVRPSSDIWSLVACCSKALTGHPPRMCKAGTDPLAGVLEGEFIPLRKRLPELPRGVGAALDRALALDPGRRFPDATEFLAELSRLE